MARRPELYERVRGEAQALFGNGREPEADAFSLDNIDVTHRLCLEAARLYPVIPWQLRTVMNECVVSASRYPPRTHLLVCQTATHYDENLFKDPLEFDIDRYLPDRSEHTIPGAYAPFGLGTHTCLGHRWVELQMTVNVLLIAYHLRLEVTPANYKMRMNPFPTSSPDRRMKFRVAEVTNPV